MRRAVWLAIAVVTLLLAGAPRAGAAPYLELRYTLLGNYPSLIGRVDCPCIGSQVVAGFEAHPWGIARWNLDVSATANFQTRWDDPESYQFGVKSDIAVGRYATWVLSYEQRHNFDRPTIVPTEYLDYRGRHTREEGNFLWGISGIRYLYTGVRWDFR